MDTSNTRWCRLDYLMYQRASIDYINKILAKKLNIFVIIYLNDIFIYTKDLG